MSWRRWVVSGTWALGLLTAAASIVAWSRPAERPSVAAQDRWLRPIESPEAADTIALLVAASQLRDRDPFRWARTPAAIRFNPWEPVAPLVSSAPPPPSRPVLGLVGLVGGPPWTALIEGIPGREGGVLLRVGERIGGIRLDEVHGSTARLSGLDTTWVLIPRQAWR
jgi:hypothetical protein